MATKKTKTTKNEKTKCEAGTPARNGKQLVH
jgi:hypothetical protein